ncbi:UNVERIFIED_CONTAM: hypothetical protein RMT77_017861 [Armadillidium vulgare]
MRNQIINEIISYLDEFDLLKERSNICQSWGYRQLACKILLKYPNILKEKSYSKASGKGELGMIISRVAERRRKRRISAVNVQARFSTPHEALYLLKTQPPVLKGMELVRTVKLSKLIREEEYNILPEFLMSPDAISVEIELKFNKSITGMLQQLSISIRKLKSIKIYCLDDVVNYLTSPGEDKILRKVIPSKEDISGKVMCGPSCFMENTREASRATIYLNCHSNPIEFVMIRPERALIITFGLYYILNLTYPRAYGQVLGFLQSVLLSEKFAEQFIGGNLKKILDILRL